MDMLSLLPSELFPFFDVPTVTYPSVSASVVQLIGQDVNRVFMGVMVNGAIGAMQVSTDKGVSSAQPGFNVTANGNPLIFTYWQHGHIVTVPWYGFSSGATGKIGILTVSLRPGITLSDDPLAAFKPPLPPNPAKRLTGSLRDYWRMVIRKGKP